MLTRFEFAARSGKHQHGLVEATVTLLGACNLQTVRKEDLDAFRDLDIQVVFVTLTMHRATNPDGTEIRD